MVVTCRCGVSWKQRGNKSGHCTICHLTFYGETAWEQHLVNREKDGTRLAETEHVDPETGKRGPWWQDEDKQWHHGVKLTNDQVKAWAKKRKVTA